MIVSLNQAGASRAVACGRRPTQPRRLLATVPRCTVAASPAPASRNGTPEPEPAPSQAEPKKPPAKRRTPTRSVRPTSPKPATTAASPAGVKQVNATTATVAVDPDLAPALSRAGAAGMLMGQLLPRVLILHTGGTLGMDPQAEGDRKSGGLKPATMLANVLSVVPELRQLSNVDLQLICNKDSARVGPDDWIEIAKILDSQRLKYDAFLIIHGTDTMAYTASALSLMLRGFKRPIVLTGSQLPLTAARTDARQNLLDSIQCATSLFSPPHINLQEVAICFGGRLLRGNRARKVHSSSYQAFDSPGYPHLAQLGIDVAWNESALLRSEGAYVPRLKLEARVLRVPVLPGCDPRQAYGDLVGRGIKGIVLEAYGVGTLPDLPDLGWMPWLQEQADAGLKVAVVSQCGSGPLRPELYASSGPLGSVLSASISAKGGMTPECAVVKTMLTLAYPDLAMGEAIAGEL